MNRTWLIDLGSANGTFINGEPASEPIPVEPGDVLTFGETSFRFKPA
jgi:pSer/pThr/pTyr-binding forkhead associated (FHA) protein